MFHGMAEYRDVDTYRLRSLRNSETDLGSRDNALYTTLDKLHHPNAAVPHSLIERIGYGGKYMRQIHALSRQAQDPLEELPCMDGVPALAFFRKSTAQLLKGCQREVALL